jgi:hypothetical protein
VSKEIKELHKSYFHALARIEQRTAKILTAGQKQIIEDFKPCLIPPKNLRNPTRAGQANDSGRIVQLLSRSRTMPVRKFERRFDAYFDKHIYRLEDYHGPMSDEEIAAEEKRIIGIIRNAHAMSDVDFEINKEEIARRIDPRNKIKKLKANGRSEKPNRPGKVARFLLSDRVVPILEARVASAKNTSYLKTTKLDTIKPAENCRTNCVAE